MSQQELLQLLLTRRRALGMLGSAAGVYLLPMRSHAATLEFGSTGWDGSTYITTATTPSVSDLVSIAAASYTFKENNTYTGVKETATLSAYYLSKYQVTNANWKAYCNANSITTYPTYWSSGGGYPTGKANHPVLFVSYTQAVAYCAWLSSLYSGYTFRLPTEAEWEYAAIGSNSTYTYPWGASAGTSYSSGVLTTKFNYQGYCAAYLLNSSGINYLSYVNDSVVTNLASGTAISGDQAAIASVLSLSASGGVTGWNYSGTNDYKADFLNSDQYSTLVNNYGGYTTPVGTFSTGASWAGCLDMAGNCFEFTSTVSLATVGAESGTWCQNVRGGSWYAAGNSCRSTYRGEGRNTTGAFHSVGFRVAAS
ncbi:MAG: SUMF1/EgtB/PvdO family nonheme iron enzyme [Steroidobacteraceae bacterium]